MATDYDSGKVTDRERTAANHLGKIGAHNIRSIEGDYWRQVADYDYANQQNRSLADVQNKQNAQLAASERFAANKKLQSAVSGLLGTTGNAMNGSSVYNLLDMIGTRTDLDNNEAWRSFRKNRNTVENAYQESENQNNLNRNEAATKAERAMRDIEGDISAQLNNINPNLWVAPQTSDADFGSNNFAYPKREYAKQASMSGYLMPEAAKQQAQAVQAPNQITGNSYYDRLINAYNRR